MNYSVPGGDVRRVGVARWLTSLFRIKFKRPRIMEGGLAKMLSSVLSTPFMSASYLFASLVCFGLAQPILSLYLLALWAMTSPQLLWSGSTPLPALLRSYQRGPFMSGLAVGGLTLALVLASAQFSPAQAQFLQSAEQAATELTSGLGGGTDISPVISFIFGALRLLLIVYMAVALIQIVNSARQGEEWKDLARTPLLIILVVIIGDFIATIFVGGGGAAV